MTEAFFSERQQQDFRRWVSKTEANGRPYWKVTDTASAFEYGWLYGREYGLELAEDALDIAETKLARIELILNDPTIDREDVAHTIWGLFDED